MFRPKTEGNLTLKSPTLALISATRSATDSQRVPDRRKQPTLRMIHGVLSAKSQINEPLPRIGW